MEPLKGDAVHIVGYYLDMNTGNQLPVVEVVVGRTHGKPRVALGNATYDIPDAFINESEVLVAVVFQTHPDYTLARCQMMDHVYSGPRAVPHIFAIGTDINEMEEMTNF